MTARDERLYRLFFALWPSDALRAEIERETRDAVDGSGGRRIPVENLHLTAVFLGAIAESRITDVFDCAADIQPERCEIALSQIVWWRRQALLCLEPLQSSDALNRSVEALRSALREGGFRIEDQRFRAHVTLARAVRREPALKTIKEVRWQVDRIELIESRTSPRGSVYSVLHRSP